MNDHAEHAAEKKKFSGRGLFANSAIASVGAGAAAAASTGLIWPVLVAAAAGAIIAYASTNEIPDDGE